MTSEERQEEIVEKSYQLFKQNGYDNVSVMDICRACQITKPTFYKYIESKEDLLTHFFDGTVEAVMDMLIARQNNPDYMEQVWSGVSFVVERSVEIGHDLYSRYLQYIFHSHNPTKRYNSKATPLIKKAIAKAQESGQILNDHPVDEIFLTLRNVCLGLSCQWCFGEGDFDLVKNYRRAFESLVQPNWEHLTEAQEDLDQQDWLRRIM